MRRFVLVTIILMFSAVTGCTIVSGALDLSPTPGIATKPASTVTIKPSLTANAILPTSAATSMSQRTTPPLSTATSTTASQHKVLEKWQIEFALSGGVAGLRRTVELSDTGQLTVTDQKASRQVVAQVPATELAEIVSFLPAVERFQPAGRLPACQDCFQYELGVSMDGQRFSIQLNDLVMVESGLAPLINALVRLQERALSGQLKP